ncbi:MAG: hypothetical protein IPL50_18260 [Chitinophagaceae bacterium]|nr:hypothetical protein [Chitinophagaceae bacterium]
MKKDQSVLAKNGIGTSIHGQDLAKTEIKKADEPKPEKTTGNRSNNSCREQARRRP